MKIAARELNLLGLTLAVVVLALTYLALEPKFREWTEFRERRADLLARQELAQRRLDSRPDVEARLEEFRRGLSRLFKKDLPLLRGRQVGLPHMPRGIEPVEGIE